MKDKYGFSSFYTAEAAKKFSVACELDSFKHNILSEREINEYVIETLSTNLANEIIKRRCFNIEYIKHPDGTSTAIGTINTVSMDVKFKTVENDCFISASETFTEEQIDKALRIAYPERFI